MRRLILPLIALSILAAVPAQARPAGEASDAANNARDHADRQRSDKDSAHTAIMERLDQSIIDTLKGKKSPFSGDGGVCGGCHSGRATDKGRGHGRQGGYEK